ncbi:hypothetical protein CO172_00060 [Candidatus Uhrbacteria bacterium CG_4_9_14_3_um_filter_36_7]|uniref:UDP-glucose/GDP-mannose dehydrogenase C-terminal domain-containing protein n=1 Tax=Candidatus Uhrbacteria bacterium CG_4_9_14_3_um_filter_36_7 TaxID=1975033 RepID=A0A2M7XII9_9BACT|nr:MAG: hypothetical protein CO172_00060 [Candidatus Uhrbacteria bacterium CG_4_9_14_3_um_filter_36_7]
MAISQKFSTLVKKTKSEISRDKFKKNKKITTRSKTNTNVVIGLGYVGLPLLFLMKKRLKQVTGVDIDAKKVFLIEHRELPFHDETLLKNFPVGKKLSVTTEFRVVEQAQTVIVCVPTPVTNAHEPDLRPLKEACYSFAQFLRPGTLVVIESSIYPGTTRDIVQPILEKGSGLSIEKGEFFLAHCPERINPADPYWHVENIPRVVGGVNKASTQNAASWYRKILGNVQVEEMESSEEAEAVKMVENAFRDVNIAFVNELAIAFEAFGINIVHVIKGASSKPFAFLPHYPGCGVGGHCIPVDPYYLIERAQKNGVSLHLLRTARQVNNFMPEHTVERTYQALASNGSKDLSGKVVTVLGLAYKRNTDDQRESPSHTMIKLFKQRGFQVRAYDPYLPKDSSATSLKQALVGSDVAVIATDHDQFIKTITPELLKRYQISLIVDGRNCLSKEPFEEKGIHYIGIGT